MRKLHGRTYVNSNNYKPNNYKPNNYKPNNYKPNNYKPNNYKPNLVSWHSGVALAVDAPWEAVYLAPYILRVFSFVCLFRFFTFEIPALPRHSIAILLVATVKDSRRFPATLDRSWSFLSQQTQGLKRKKKKGKMENVNGSR